MTYGSTAWQWLSYRFDTTTRIHAVESINGSPYPGRQNTSYNFFNKPVFIADAEDSLNYTYNVLDDRIKATLYGTGGLVRTTWYAGLYQKTLENSVTKHYYYINGPDGPVALGIQTGGDSPVIYYLCKDHLGSITGIMNSSGNILEEYNYDVWGKRRNPADWSYTNVPAATYTNRGFTGHEHLDMFNLINMNGRVYDPEIARFVSPDPIIQDLYDIISYNRYTYCLNNPLKYTDPSGYSREAILRDMEENQKNAMGSVQFFNNYVGWWQEFQASNAKGTWQFYMSSGFTSQFPNAKVNFNFSPSRNELGTWIQDKQSEYGLTQSTELGYLLGEVQVGLVYVPYIVFSNDHRSEAEYPFDGAKIGDTYHINRPSLGNHNGVDFYGKEGTKIKSLSSGTVVSFVQKQSQLKQGLFGGVYVQISNNGYITYYGHLKEGSTSQLTIGLQVNKGDVIGEVGNTGRCIPSTYYHLHLQVWDVNNYNSPHDPLEIYPFLNPK